MASRRSDAAGEGKLTLRGGSRPRLARQRKPAWSRATEARFFETLAETCNVGLAAQAAGVRPQRAYEKRRGDAAFRRRWGEAVSIGYARLELMLLQRALNAAEKPIDQVGGDTKMRDYSNQLALALLKMHRDTAAESDFEASDDELHETRERITAKLRKLLSRETAEPAAKAGEE